jgi:hypothetical protein
MLRKTMIVLAMAAALTGGLTADALARGGGGGGHGGGFGGAHVGGGFGLPVAARDTGQRENQPIYAPMVSEAHAARQPAYVVPRSSDSFEIRGDQYVAIITNGKGIIPEGTRISVPKNKVKWDNGNPTGHGIIFIGNAGQIYCYVTPGGTALW